MIQYNRKLEIWPAATLKYTASFFPLLDNYNADVMEIASFSTS